MNALAVVTAIMLVSEGASDCSFDWLPTEGLPGLDGPGFAAVVWDPDGPGPERELLVVGGGFSIAGDKIANSIAAWDGTSWRTFGAGGTGTALTVYNGDLIAAGASARLEGTLTAFIERWDGSSWRSLGTGFSGGGTNSPRVEALTTYEGDLIAAGSFAIADGSGANNIARWDGSSWHSLGNGLTRSNSFAHVDSLVVYKGDLIAGGYFDTAGGKPAKGVARWDGSEWWDVGGGLDRPPYLPSVNALIVVGDDLIAGGQFSRAGGIAARNIARWDGESWHEFAPGAGAYSWINALASFNGDFVAAGPFHPGQIARWDGEAWYPLGSGISRNWDPLGGCDPILVDPSVRTLVVYQNELIAGGGFKFAGEKSTRHIARWNGAEWNTLGGGMSIPPGALAVHEGKLIAGGGFQTAAENTRSLITAWDGQSWETLGHGVEGVIRALASYHGDIIVGGQFGAVGERAAWYVARWDGSQWQPLGTGVGNEYECAWVDGLVVFGGDLFIGGEFHGAGNTDARNIARWDGVSWHTLGEGIAGSFGAMTVYADKLIVGGSFNSAGGRDALNIAAWDGSNWEPLGGGLDGSVQALTVFGGEVVAFFLLNDEFPATHVARWDGNSWISMGLGMDNYVAALAVYNGELFATGDFTNAGGIAVESIARWDGAAWHPMPGGVIYWAWDLIVYRGELFVAGSAALSDGGASANLSRWGPTTARADFDADGDVDLLDLIHLPVCVTGPTLPSGSAIAPRECLCTFNSDGDGDIDLVDIAAVQNAFTSSQHK